VVIPELDNIYREAHPEDFRRIVPNQTFRVKTSSAPKLALPATKGAPEHFISRGLPDDQLISLAKSTGKKSLLFLEDHSKEGFLNQTSVRLKSGEEVSLRTYLARIPGIQVKEINKSTATRAVDVKDGVVKLRMESLFITEVKVQ